MTLTYNDNTYTVKDGSIYTDFSIDVSSLDEACKIVTALEGMSEYTFSNVSYSNMVVTRRIISLDGTSIVVKVRLRRKSEKDLVKEELNNLKSAMEELALTTNKTTSAKINKLLKKGVE